jgi:hypothetical protein
MASLNSPVGGAGSGGNRPAYVIGPNGLALTLEDLPSADTERWVLSRKAAIVAAVRGDLLSMDEACDRYSLSADEFTGWMRAMERSGLAGLRVTRSQFYTSRYRRDQEF